ncbi:MAG: hypothetical protein JWP47_2514 [Polaromonas sp.]|nr:hypothetical protein [Polaromonas sp.]
MMDAFCNICHPFSRAARSSACCQQRGNASRHGMKNIMTALFRTVTAAGLSKIKTPSSSRLDNPLTIQDGSENSARRQLIQILLRDLLDRHGIPANWIRCEMLMISSRSRGPGLYVRLIVSQWDDRLMHYLYAVQSQFRADILKFEPDSVRWMHGMSWQFDVSESCPYVHLPQKAYWAKTAPSPEQHAAELQPSWTVSPGPAAVAGDSEPRDDIEKLFAIRDRELNRQSMAEMTPVGYEKTQPSPL